MAVNRRLPAATEYVLRRSPWFAFPCGAALALAFAPFNVWPLAVLCPAVLFLLWQGAAPRRAAQTGFWFSAGTFLAGTYWLYHSVHIIGDAPIWIALLLMSGLVAIMGGYMALVGYGLARWGPGEGWLRWIVALPAAWVALEWFRGWFLSGFPWLALGYSQLDTPLAGYAPLLGVYGVSAIAALTAGVITALVFRPHSASLRALIVPSAGVFAVWIGGYAFTFAEWTQPTGTPLRVAIVQGAVPQALKWSAEQRQRTLALYRDLTKPHLGTDIIVWPEAALPALAHDIDGYLADRRREVTQAGSDLVTGLLHADLTTRSIYNGLVSLRHPDEWYNKRRLVPFGEFFPVPAFVRDWMRLMSLPYSDMTPGERHQAPLSAAGQKLGATICYEDAYGSEQLDVLRVATLLVNVTNDAWFGDSTAPHQHLEISRMRALEAGRMLLRGANDGVTALIDANGEIVDALPQFRPGVLTGVVQPRHGLTPYARVGNWPVVLLSMMGLVVAVMTARRAGASQRDSRTG